jgi:hypothetical protein
MNHNKYIDMLLEKHLSELYHATYPSAVLKMLKDNAIKLTFQQGADTMSNKSFYLSTMRTKYGNYADYYHGRGIGKRDTGFPKWETIPAEPGKRGVSKTAIVNINGDTVRDIATVKSVDYWGKAFHSGNMKEEQEERIFSDKPELAPLAKYVNAIHLFIGTKEDNKFRHQMLIDIHNFSTSIPIYFYDNPEYFMSQIESRALSYIQIEKLLGTVDMSDEEKADYNSQERYYGNDNIEAMLQIYRGEKSDSDAWKRVYNLLTRYQHDAYASLDADIHNNKYKHLPIFNDLAKAMRKEKIVDTRKFIQLLIKKADELDK